MYVRGRNIRTLKWPCLGNKVAVEGKSQASYAAMEGPAKGGLRKQWSGEGPAEPRNGGGAKACSVGLAKEEMVEPKKAPSRFKNQSGKKESSGFIPKRPAKSRACHAFIITSLGSWASELHITRTSVCAAISQNSR